MPQTDHLKGTVAAAAAGAERLVYGYPTRFSDIEEAKDYISTICTKNNYTYSLNRFLSLEDKTYVKDRAHFFVAAKAWEHGEFYLDTPLPDRQALRNAIKADVQRVLPLVQPWPSSFFNPSMATTYVAGICTHHKFNYTPFEGVESLKFRHYVHFHTARQGFRNGGFEMRWPLPEWTMEEKPKKRCPAPVLKPLGTLAETINADIVRLTPLLPPWPLSFPDINDARNFVSQAAYKMNFHYNTWPNLEHHRFRLFVNFNTAKDAWKARKFAVAKQASSDGVLKTKVIQDAGKMRGVGNEEAEDKDQEDEHSSSSSATLAQEQAEKGDAGILTQNWRALVGGSSSALGVVMTTSTTATRGSTIFDANASQPATNTYEDPNALDLHVENLLLDDDEIDYAPAMQNPLDDAEVFMGEQGVVEPSKTVMKDPFQDLLSDFTRADLVRAAFE